MFAGSKEGIVVQDDDNEPLVWAPSDADDDESKIVLLQDMEDMDATLARHEASGLARSDASELAEPLSQTGLRVHGSRFYV